MISLFKQEVKELDSAEFSSGWLLKIKKSFQATPQTAAIFAILAETA
jgi:hypothetical protein